MFLNLLNWPVSAREARPGPLDEKARPGPVRSSLSVCEPGPLRPGPACRAARPVQVSTVHALISNIC